MPSDKIKEILLVVSLCATLSVQTAWALTIHVTPTANPQTTLADIKKNSNTLVTLTQALRNLPSLAGGESAASGVCPTEGEGRERLVNPDLQTPTLKESLIPANLSMPLVPSPVFSPLPH